MRLLDNQCKQPVPTESAFFEGVNRMHDTCEFFRPVMRYKKLATEAFVINHFAGTCCYEAEDIRGAWLDKNNDLLSRDLNSALSKSSVLLVSEVFSGESKERLGRQPQRLSRISVGAGNRTASFGKARPGATFASISRRFCLDLNLLVAELSEADAHFIRCIKPNAKGVPLFDVGKVVEQLRSSGVFDAVELMKAAYPTKIRFDDIYGKYASLLPGELVGKLPPAGFCEVVALACDVDRGDYALGFTQLFLRSGKGTFLEDLIAMDVAEVVPLLEEKIREYERRKRAAMHVGMRVLGHHLHVQFLRKRVAARLVQRIYRGHLSRKQTRKRLAALRKNRAAALAIAAEPSGSARSHPAALHANVTIETPVDAKEVLIEQMRTELARERMASAKLMEQVETLSAQASELRSAAAGGNETIQELLDQTQQQVTSLKLELVEARKALAVERGVSEALRDEPTAQTNDNQKVIRAVSPGPRSSEPTRTSTGAKFADVDPTVVGQQFRVNIERDDASGTLGVDIDVYLGRVTVAIVDPNVPAHGKLAVGDEIEGVGGVSCKGDLNSVLKRIVESPNVVSLDICRRLPTALLRHEMQMRTAKGSWAYVMATLLDTRQLLHELPRGSRVQIEEAGEEGASGLPGEGSISIHRISKHEMVDASAEGPATLTVALVNGVLYQFRCPPKEDEGTVSGTATLRAWQQQLAQLLSGVSSPRKDRRFGLAMVWQQGYMELAIGIDEWANRYFVLDQLHGIRIYRDKSNFRLGEPERVIPIRSIGKAVRGTGLEYFEWGIHVHLNPSPDMDLSDTVLETRAPSQNEMGRWLATINMHGAYWHIDTSSAGKAEPIAMPSSLTQTRRYTHASSKRRFSALVGLPPSAKMQLELASGWLTVKKEHSSLGGSKRRFCRLIALLEVASDKPLPPMAPGATAPQRQSGTSGSKSHAYKSVMFYVLHRENDLLENEQPGHGALDMCEVVSVTAGGKNKIIIKAGMREIRITADNTIDQTMWLDVLDKHRGLLPWLNGDIGDSIHQLGPTAPPIAPDLKHVSDRMSDVTVGSLCPSDIQLAARHSQFMELSDDSGSVDFKHLSGWMEVADGDREEPEWQLGYVALLKDNCIGYYHDAAATNGPPIRRLHLAKGLVVQPLTDPPYNYEHAIMVSGDTATSWLLCPDSPDESDRWMAVLHKLLL